MDGATEDVNQCYADAGIAPPAPKRIRRDDASPDSDATVSTCVTPLVIAHYDGSYAWPGALSPRTPPPLPSSER